MLDIQAVAKNSKHWQKKIYKKFGISENRCTFVFGNGNETDTKKVIDNTESENASRHGLCVLGLYAVSLMLYKNG